VVSTVLGSKRARDRVDHAADVFQLAVEGPLGGDLEVIDVGIGDVGRAAGVERRHGLRDHVLDRVLRELDLHALVLRLVLLDRGEQRVVLGLVEALDPPDGELLLRGRLPRLRSGLPRHRGGQNCPEFH
jgi:hypothetical protein